MPTPQENRLTMTEQRIPICFEGDTPLLFAVGNGRRWTIETKYETRIGTPSDTPAFSSVEMATQFCREWREHLDEQAVRIICSDPSNYCGERMDRHLEINQAMRFISRRLGARNAYA